MQSDVLMRLVKDDIVKENESPIKAANYITKAISSPFRQKILSLLLSSNQLAVNELCEKLKSEQSVMSQHLAVLRKANLVQTQRNGKSVMYSVNEQYLQELIDSILVLTRNFRR